MIQCFHNGHTFRSADSLHGGVPYKMKRRPGENGYNFPDFCDVMQKSNGGKVVVDQMTNGDVQSYESGPSAHLFRKLDLKTLLWNMIVV